VRKRDQKGSLRNSSLDAIQRLEKGESLQRGDKYEKGGPGSPGGKDWRGTEKRTLGHKG